MSPAGRLSGPEPLGSAGKAKSRRQHALAGEKSSDMNSSKPSLFVQVPKQSIMYECPKCGKANATARKLRDHLRWRSARCQRLEAERHRGQEQEREQPARQAADALPILSTIRPVWFGQDDPSRFWLFGHGHFPPGTFSSVREPQVPLGSAYFHLPSGRVFQYQPNGNGTAWICVGNIGGPL